MGGGSMSFSDRKPENLPLVLSPGFSREQLDRILYEAYLSGASDVSLQSEDVCYFMISGKQTKATERTLQHGEVSLATNAIYGPNGSSMITQGQPIDKRYEIKPSRGVKIGFRVNITPARIDGNERGISITCRVLPQNPPTIFSQKVPSDIVMHALPKNGLIAVSGVTSSGKSTLLAGLIRYAYELKESNVVTSAGRKIGTYESPVEYVYDGIEPIGPRISQTSVGAGEDGGLSSWSEAVKTAMRRALSIILIGECRDSETMNECISAALTGHCTLTTVHANRVGVAFRRMVSMAEAGEGAAAGEKLLGSLSMIIVQTLSPRIGGGRVAFREWIPITQTMQDKFFGIPSAQVAFEIQKETIKRGSSMGHSALMAYQRKEVSLIDACAYSGLTKPELFALELNEAVFEPFTEETLNAIA